MLLQYVAASFHLPSVSTANTNTVQYTKSHKQYEIPIVPAIVISKVLLPQSNIMATFVHSNSSLFSDVCPGLPTYNNHNITPFAAYSVQSLAADLFRILPKTPPTHYNTF